MDNSQEVIETGEKNSHYFNSQVSFYLADVFNLPFADNEFKVCFSQGVLEHYSANKIKDALIEQLRVAYHVIFSVPSINWRGEGFGDENFWPLDKWLGVLKDFYLVDFDGYGYSSSLTRFLDIINKKVFKNKFKKIFVKFFATEFCFTIKARK